MTCANGGQVDRQRIARKSSGAGSGGPHILPMSSDDGGCRGIDLLALDAREPRA